MSVQDRTTRDAHERALFDIAMSPPAATSGPRSDDSPAPVLVDMAALVADSKRAVEEYTAGDKATVAAFLKVRAALSDEHYALFHEHSSAAFSWNLQGEELLIAELCRHLPAHAVTIRAVVSHIYSDDSKTGACCLPEGSVS